MEIVEEYRAKAVAAQQRAAVVEGLLLAVVCRFAEDYYLHLPPECFDEASKLKMDVHHTVEDGAEFLLAIKEEGDTVG